MLIVAQLLPKRKYTVRVHVTTCHKCFHSKRNLKLLLHISTRCRVRLFSVIVKTVRKENKNKDNIKKKKKKPNTLYKKQLSYLQIIYRLR